MDIGTLLAALAPLMVVAFLAIALLGLLGSTAVGRLHPLRTLDTMLSAAFFLALITLAVPVAGPLAVAWWAVLCAVAVVGIIALLRGRVASSEEQERAAAPLPPRGDPQRRAAHRDRRRVRRATRPTMLQLGVSVLLVAAAVSTGIIAGSGIAGG